MPDNHETLPSASSSMDANHYGTLYAGSLLKRAEAAYAAATRGVGSESNHAMTST